MRQGRDAGLSRRAAVVLGLVLAGTIGLAPGAAVAAKIDPVVVDPVVLDLGNGIVASIDSGSGAVRVATATPLVWDPNFTEVNRFDYGAGWTFGTRLIDVMGGVRFYFPDLSEFFELDLTLPTGLRGYPRGDVRADRLDEPGEIPARGDIPARPYYYTLHHLDTNVTEYFSWDGDLIASIDQVARARTDWVFDDNGGHRLLRLADESGRTTQL